MYKYRKTIGLRGPFRVRAKKKLIPMGSRFLLVSSLLEQLRSHNFHFVEIIGNTKPISQVS